MAPRSHHAAIGAAVGALLFAHAPVQAAPPTPAQAAPTPLSIRIASPADVEARRQAIRSLVWPTGYPTDRRPDEVGAPYLGDYWSGVPNLKEVRRLTIRQPHGIDVYGWHLAPKISSGRSMIVHHGHQPGPEDDPYWRHLDGRFVAEGFDVLVMTMPLYYPNPRKFDGVELWHDDLRRFRTPTFNPLSYFMTPTIAGINYLKDATGRDVVHMTGLSGGGWASTIMPAIDPRIMRSYPTAGTMPLSTWPTPSGDYEQADPELYALASYEDLYLMGSSGPGQAQIQILNEYDPCCFSVASGFSPDSWAYATPIAGRSRTLGGAWRLWIDRGQHEHTISDAAVDMILSDFKSIPASPCDDATRIAVVASRAAHGGIDVTIRTRDTRNRILRVRIDDAQGKKLATAPVIAPNGLTATFTTQRTTTSIGSHLPFTVTDLCGEWPTFVGSGR